MPRIALNSCLHLPNPEITSGHHFSFLISGKPQRILIKLTDLKFSFPLVACSTAISLKDTNFGLKDKWHRSDRVVG